MAAAMKTLISARFTNLLKIRALKAVQQSNIGIRSCSTNNGSDPYKSNIEMDIESLFIENRVQQLLRRLTGMNLDKIFAPRKVEHEVPEYRFMTDKQLQEATQEAIMRAGEKLQMPPVLRERKPCERVVKVDPAIQGYDTSSYIFTDISYGYKDKDRIIYVREPNGVLRTASWEEREQMMNTYFSNPDKEFYVPPMFNSPHLDNVLEKRWYSFVLDRCCVQFEPDSPDFIRVTHAVYDHINDVTHDFESLRSTRHFGPMTFYLCVTKKLDNFLIDFLERRSLNDAIAAIELYHIVHSKPPIDHQVEDKLVIVQAFIKADAQKRPALELAMQVFKEWENSNEKEEMASTA